MNQPETSRVAAVPSADDLLTAEVLEAVFAQSALELQHAIRERLEQLRDAYEDKLRRRGEEWEKETEALLERVRKAEVALGELRLRFTSLQSSVARSQAPSGASQGTEWASRPDAGPGGLAADLRAQGFEVIDKRASGGNLWVLGETPKLRPVITALQHEGVKFRFSQKGARATGGRAAWFTKSTR